MASIRQQMEAMSRLQASMAQASAAPPVADAPLEASDGSVSSDSEGCSDDESGSDFDESDDGSESGDEDDETETKEQQPTHQIHPPSVSKQQQQQQQHQQQQAIAQQAIAQQKVEPLQATEPQPTLEVSNSVVDVAAGPSNSESEGSDESGSGLNSDDSEFDSDDSEFDSDESEGEPLDDPRAAPIPQPLNNESQGLEEEGKVASAGGGDDDDRDDSSENAGSSEDDDETNSEDDDDEDFTGTGDDDSYSSEDSDSEYGDLMLDLMGKGQRKPAPLKPAPLPPRPTAPVMTAGLVPITNADEGLDPMQGLAMLQNIRSELEQVGRMIVTQKTGEKFLQRAHILASINWLATNVPSCVLDHLGQEIREGIKAKAENKERFSGFEKKPGASMQRRGSVMPSFDLHFEDDEASEASDLSDIVMNYKHDGDDDDDEISLAYATVRKDSANFEPKTDLKHSVSFDMDENYSPRRALNRTFSSQSGPGLMQTNGNATFTKSSDGTAPTRILPSVSHFECALLFVDISGFTQLSTMLDPENLSKVINNYFELITKTVADFLGDIQKFAGDALFAEWRVSETRTKAYCVDLAAHCAATLVKVCQDFPVMAFGGIVETAEGNGSPVTTLNIHCGLGVGSMAGIHIGDSLIRREYVYVGDPIRQATSTCNEATFGQALASTPFLEELLCLGMIDESVALNGVIADGSTSHLKMTCHEFQRNANSRGVTEHVDGLELEALIEYRRLMSLYVHPVVVSNDVAAADDFKSSNNRVSTRENHQDESELRSVYVMFIKPDVAMKLTGNVVQDKEVARLLNSIMLITTRELKKYHGHLRQTILDDKGLVLIATFGLRGSTFPNLVSERALPATVLIHNALLVELGVESNIGCTFGDVYCGPVGGTKRQEYAVMGPSVNLAARLMSLPENNGILVDNAVRHLASKAYGFNALAPVKAKGYKDLVPIFEPLAALDRSWGRIEPNFVGRSQELAKLVNVSREMTREKLALPRLVLISSASGLGKSCLLTNGIEHIRRTIGGRRRLLILKNVGSENHSLVPFTTIRPILLKILGAFNGSSNEQSFASNTMSINGSSIPGSTAFDGDMSVTSQALSHIPTLPEATEKLMAIAEILNVPTKLALRVQAVVLEGSSPEIKSLSVRSKAAAAAISEMSSFIAQIFRTCSREASLMLIAIDDIHHADTASWQVLRYLFENLDNILIIGTNYATSNYTLHIDKSFAEALNSAYLDNGRFVNIELGPLSQAELELLTMKTLGLQSDEVSPQTLSEVVNQSGGSPHFASKILKDIKERMAGDKTRDFTDEDEGLADIILHRFDSFDLTVRNTLNVGAVMGSSFRLGDVLSVLKESSDMKDEDLRTVTIDALKLAVNQGILACTGQGGDDAASDVEAACASDDVLFRFRHELWRSTLLGLMLNSRQRHVHKKVAQAIESSMGEDASLEHRRKLFGHWKSSGDTTKASDVALLTGKALEQDPNSVEESLFIYKETLQMWGWDASREESVAGFSPQVLDYIGATDVANMVSLLVAYGSNLTKLRKHKDSVRFFQDSLRVVEAAKASSKLDDRSIIFPAYMALAKALEGGHIQQDAYCRYEAALLLSFLNETRSHGRLIHHIYALYLQMQFYSRRNQLLKAIAVHSVIKQLYKPEKHSSLLRKVYGTDAGAMSFCLASHFQMVLGENRQAIRNCRNVIRDLFPRIETDFLQSFSMMYSLVFVLNESGYSAEARGFFERVVVLPFGDQIHQHDDKLSLLTIYEPLVILLDLSVKGELSDSKLDEYRRWALVEANLSFDPSVNIKLGRLGRCGDSVGAEICLLVAAHLPDSADQRAIIAHGTYCKLR
jgi:class 3 adenylate cyclase